MAFTGNEDHDIPLNTAAEWTERYRNANPPGVTLAHYFGKEAIQDLLNQDLCVGVRMYYAIDDDNNKQLILVGVDDKENDLYEGIILDRSYRCPPSCSTANPLNS